MALRSNEFGTRRWRKMRERILARDNYTCVYCGENADQVDHVVARKNGGTNDEHNLVAACKRCNQIKAAKKGLFLGPTATPPDSLSKISPSTRSESHVGPFAGQQRPVQAL